MFMFSSNVHWVFYKDIRIQDEKIEKQTNLSDLTSYTRCRDIPFSFQLLSYDLLPQPCASMLSCFRLLASASISAPWLGGGLVNTSQVHGCWLSFTPWMSKKITKRHRNCPFFLLWLLTLEVSLRVARNRGTRETTPAEMGQGHY